MPPNSYIRLRSSVFFSENSSSPRIPDLCNSASFPIWSVIDSGTGFMIQWQLSLSPVSLACSGSFSLAFPVSRTAWHPSRFARTYLSSTVSIAVRPQRSVSSPGAHIPG